MATTTKEEILRYRSAGELNGFQLEEAEAVGAARTVVCGVGPKSLRQILKRTVFLRLAHRVVTRIDNAPSGRFYRENGVLVHIVYMEQK